MDRPSGADQHRSFVEGISINKSFKFDAVQTTARRSLFQF